MTSPGQRDDRGDDGDEEPREVVAIALEAGYFDDPRRTSSDELADELDLAEEELRDLLHRGIKKLTFERYKRG